MKRLFFILLSIFFVQAYAQDLNIIKGKSLLLSFNKANFKEARLNDKSLIPLPHPTNKDKILILITSPYKKPLKEANLRLVCSDKTLEFKIKGEQGTYPKESLQVPKHKVSPPKEVQKRIQDELKIANQVYASFTKEMFLKSAFEMPLNSAITSQYGSARVYNNGALASFHGGTDFRAPTGTPIKAANDGIVRLSMDRYYAGKSVIIDHGYKIFTQYYHLDKLLVKEGQRVKKGDIIALSGASGRVTGAHLHLGIFANGTQIDPLDFIAKFNALLK